MAAPETAKWAPAGAHHANIHADWQLNTLTLTLPGPEAQTSTLPVPKTHHINIDSPRDSYIGPDQPQKPHRH